MTVDFGGFIQLVNEIGGVYVMVDQHYYHVNTPGTEQYSQIDIPPGYQLLSGVNALAFSRYRHTDSDFYRNARQQVFLRAFEQAASRKFHGLGLDQLTALRDVVETVTSNVQVTGHSGVPGVQTMIRYLALAYRIKGRVVTVKLDATTAGDATNSYVTATPEAIHQAVYQWEHPQELWHPGAIPGAGGKPTKPPWTPAVTPSTVQVTVLNGNGRTGSAGQAATDLQVWGYQASSSITPAPTFTLQADLDLLPAGGEGSRRRPGPDRRKRPVGADAGDGPVHYHDHADRGGRRCAVRGQAGARLTAAASQHRSAADHPHRRHGLRVRTSRRRSTRSASRCCTRR